MIPENRLELITDVNDIILLAAKDKAIYVKRWKRHSPAKFILNWQLSLIMRWLNTNQFYKILPNGK